MDLDLLILGQAFEWAARIAAWVIGDDGIVVGKQTCYGVSARSKGSLNTR